MSRFSFIKSKNHNSSDVFDDDESKVSTVIPEVPLPAPTLKYKRLDYYYSRWGKGWKYRVRALSSFSCQSLSSGIITEYEPKGHRRDAPNYEGWRPRPLERFLLRVSPQIPPSPRNMKPDHQLPSVVRTLPQTEDTRAKPTFKVVIKSGYIRKACKEVIQTLPGVSWNADPLEVRE